MVFILALLRGEQTTSPYVNFIVWVSPIFCKGVSAVVFECKSVFILNLVVFSVLLDHLYLVRAQPIIDAFLS